jgi:hypothetical protein
LRIIQRELNFTLNDTVTLGQILQKQNDYCTRLNNSPIIAYANCKVDTIGFKQLHFHFTIKESFPFLINFNASLADRNFNIWWNDQNASFRRLNFAGKITKLNVQGLNRTLSMDFQYGFTNRIGLKYSIPEMGNSQNHELSFTADYMYTKEFHHLIENNKQKFYRNEKLDLLQKIHAEVQFTYRYQYASKFSVALGRCDYTIAKELSDVSPNFLGKEKINLFYWENILQYKFLRIDNTFYPKKGLQARIIFNNKFSTTFQQVQQSSVYAFLIHYKTLPHQLYTVFSSRNRWMFKQSDAFVLQRALGFGYDYIRGYEYYVMNGSHFSCQKLDLKKEVFFHTFNQKKIMRTPQLPVYFYPKVFADYGYVQSISDGLNNQLRNIPLYSIGAGFDFMIDRLFMARIEYAMNHLKQKGLFLHLISL